VELYRGASIPFTAIKGDYNDNLYYPNLNSDEYSTFSVVNSIDLPTVVIARSFCCSSGACSLYSDSVIIPLAYPDAPASPILTLPGSLTGYDSIFAVILLLQSLPVALG
jgi:hypothetical protein